MVDRDVVLRKSEAIAHHASRLRAKLPLRPSAIRLARAAGLRNLIVHRYADIAAPRLVEAIESGLGDLEDCSSALRKHAKP